MTELRHPTQFTRGIEKTPAFLEQLSLDPTNPTRAIARSALQLSRSMKERGDKRNLLDAYSVAIIGQLPDFFEASAELARENDGNRWDRRSAIAKAVPFNHTIREIVDSFPGLTINELRTFCGNTAVTLLDQKDAKACDQMAFEAIVGMLYEVGLEQILWSIDGVESVQKAETVEDESKGIDVTVVYNGVTIYLDAKASKRGEDEALKKRDQYMAQRGIASDLDVQSGYPIWPGMRYEDFHGSFRIDKQTIDRCAPYVEKVLQYLAGQTAVSHNLAHA